MAEKAAVIDTEAPPRWEIVEIMGHRRHYGRIEEIQQFGVAMIRVLVFIEGDEPTEVFQYSGAAIFSICDCTEEYARDGAKRQGLMYRPVALISGPVEASGVGFEEPPF